MTHTESSSALAASSKSTNIVLSQLANLYTLFAVNETLVLRSTSDVRVWRTLLFCLLLADIGHLASVKSRGSRIYWDVSSWNAMDWGNVGFVYAGAAMRIAFLAGFGNSSRSKVKMGAHRSPKIKL